MNKLYVKVIWEKVVSAVFILYGECKLNCVKLQ